MSIRAGHREERMTHHSQIRAHPGVHVARDGDHHLRLGEQPLHLHPGHGHAEVESVRTRTDRVHVVEGLIVVAERDGLPRADAGDARQEFAAALIDHDRVRGDRVVAVRNALLHPDERFRTPAVRVHEHRRGAGRSLRALRERSASDPGRGGDRPAKLHHPADRRRPDAAGRSRPQHRRRRLLLARAAESRRKDEPDCQQAGHGRQWYPLTPMALRELVDLRQDAAALCADCARIDLAVARGTPFPQLLSEIIRLHRLACSRDGLAQAVEALESAASPGRASRLGSLRDFLVRARALALDPGAAQELLEFPRRPTVRLHGDPGLHGALPPMVADRDLPGLREREERADMESALAQAEREAAAARSAAWEAAQAALSELDAGDPLDAALELHARGWAAPATKEEAPAPKAVPQPGSPLIQHTAPVDPDVDPVTDACERFLRATDGVARDLGSWLLERETGARAAPGGAERHDLLRFIHVPRCAGAFPLGELLRTVRRWAGMLRLDLSAGGTIAIEEEDRPLQPAGARAV